MPLLISQDGHFAELGVPVPVTIDCSLRAPAPCLSPWAPGTGSGHGTGAVRPERGGGPGTDQGAHQARRRWQGRGRGTSYRQVPREPHPEVARNFPRSVFDWPHKPWNVHSKPERLTEIRATFSRSYKRHDAEGHRTQKRCMRLSTAMHQLGAVHPLRERYPIRTSVMPLPIDCTTPATTSTNAELPAGSNLIGKIPARKGLGLTDQV